MNCMARAGKVKWRGLISAISRTKRRSTRMNATGLAGGVAIALAATILSAPPALADTRAYDCPAPRAGFRLTRAELNPSDPDNVYLVCRYGADGERPYSEIINIDAGGDCEMVSMGRVECEYDDEPGGVVTTVPGLGDLGGQVFGPGRRPAGANRPLTPRADAFCNNAVSNEYQLRLDFGDALDLDTGCQVGWDDPRADVHFGTGAIGRAQLWLAGSARNARLPNDVRRGLRAAHPDQCRGLPEQPGLALELSDALVVAGGPAPDPSFACIRSGDGAMFFIVIPTMEMSTDTLHPAVRGSYTVRVIVTRVAD